MKILLLLVGGALGALARYALTDFVHRFLDNSFPYGTLIVNSLGCLFIGVLGALWMNWDIPTEYRYLIFIGVLGSFTTFSTYSLETFNLLVEGSYRNAVINIALNNILGILLVFGGFLLTRHLLNNSGQM